MSLSSFEFIRDSQIPSLHTQVREYLHPNTGARHFHLACEDTNNAFLVAFKTVPHDSTGVAHILEHTTLCGSRHYPVRDPFFMMIRRSLNTFMNAFTASDWTAYPFASQNKKDFNNLLQVYLDAVFFPKLDALDFAQEGHRVEFSSPNDPNSDLEYKGVVFNEMKGAMSSPVRELWQTLQSNLFPTTTYHYNSGGDPEQIPNLTYEQLTSFHASHYHPSNALFMTYGNFPVEAHQEMIEEHALSHFERLKLDLNIGDEQRYTHPIPISSHYPLDGEEQLAHKTHIVMGWLLGKSADLKATMEAELLAGVLLDNSASPLRRALETTDLGTAPSEICGFDSDTRESVFACGLEGSDPDNTKKVETLILDVLTDAADNGVPREQVEAVLHQLELSQREVGGGRFPYGLQLIVKALPAVIHGSDPVEVLDLDPVLIELRKAIQDDNFIKSLTRKLLLDNPHRVTLTMTPDTQLSAQRAASEAEHLKAMKQAMTEDDKQQIIKLAETLKKRQEAEDDPEVLPKVGIEDISADLNIPEATPAHIDGMPGTWFGQATNGLVYQQMIAELPQLDADLITDLPLFSECLTEVGSGSRNYLQVQSWQASVSGGISARASVRSTPTDLSQIHGYFIVAGKALARNEAHLSELLYDTFFNARFDELPRLRELIAQMRAYREAQITASGHSLAMTAASAGLSPIAALSQRWSGLDATKQLKSLDELLESKDQLTALAGRFTRIRDALITMPRQLLIVGEDSQRESLSATMERQWGDGQKIENTSARFGVEHSDHPINQVWSVNTQVNFCAKAYPTVAQDHADTAALVVLGPFLRNGFLHRAIREQGGAYGAGAGYNSDTGAFRFFSYRDPRLGGTLEDFDKAVEWVLNTQHEPRQLEEAILGVISDIDRPDSPAGEAIGTFFSSLHHRTPEYRRRYRSRILDVSLEELQRITGKYLRPDAANVAIISNQVTIDEHQDLGLKVCYLA